MIHIEDIDGYLSHPALHKHIHRQQLPEDMVYKAMMYLPKTFKTNEIMKILETMWGIKLSNQLTSVGLRRLREAGYVSRFGKNKTYCYGKTALYERDLIKKLDEMKPSD